MSVASRVALAVQAIAARFKAIIAVPAVRTVALGTAYQATVPTRGALVTVTLTSTASLSLTAGGNNTADLVIGPANTIGTTGGVVVGKYANSNTGTLTIGLGLSTVSTASYTLAVPAGYWFAVRQTAGTVTVVGAVEQAIG